ncbi:MAG: hypothetical protein Q7J80_06495 [Anaerolineales bacterium]|nr:hypothetical protein [Anaerolineales bacterium]
MWINTPESKEIVKEFSKELIAEIAPEEIGLVDELLEDYYANPNMQPSKDNPLGFGSEILAASTPVVAMALQVLFNYIITEVWTSAQKEGAAVIAQKVKKLINPEPHKTEPALGLDQEQLKKAKQLIKKEAMRGGMNSKKAEDFALKLVARIALKS